MIGKGATFWVYRTMYAPWMNFETGCRHEAVLLNDRTIYPSRRRQHEHSNGCEARRIRQRPLNKIVVEANASDTMSSETLL